MKKTIREIMTTRVVTVTLDDRLAVVKDIFDGANGKFHHLPVLEDDKLIGILSIIDLLRATGPDRGPHIQTINDLLALKNPVHRIVTRHPVTISPDATLEEAITLLLKHSFACLPVVDKEKNLLGIVTVRDFLKNWPVNAD